MAVKIPDFILNCYSTLDGEHRVDDLLSSFFLSVKDHKSIDGGMASGGKERFKTDISTHLDSFEGEITLSSDSFVLEKNVTFENGNGYVVRFIGSRNKGCDSYSGTFRAIDKSTNKINPYYGGEFQINATHFFKKYNIN